jgi:hypothetical protein
MSTEMTKQGNQQMVHVPDPGEVTQQGFGQTSIERQGDLSVRAMAKQAEAQIQARYVMAMQNRRDIMKSRAALLRDCERPVFAAKAIYNKPIGEGVEGPSIRLAEAAARAMGNVLTDVSAIYDDDKKRIVRIIASDLEANVTYTKDVTVNKTVERSKPMEGRKIISQRVNSKGRPVFVIEATDDEILDREGALASKAMRTCLLRLIPGDILEEAIQKCYETQDKKDAEDPDAARKGMCDAFAGLGVTIDQIVLYLGHSIEQTNPKDMKSLRGIYNAIKDGEATWAEAIASKEPQTKPAEPTAAPTTAAQDVQQAPPKSPPTLADVAAKSKQGRVTVQGPDGEQIK